MYIHNTGKPIKVTFQIFIIKELSRNRGIFIPKQTYEMNSIALQVDIVDVSTGI